MPTVQRSTCVRMRRPVRIHSSKNTGTDHGDASPSPHRSVVAAAALHALEHHVDRLADDHALATRLAEGLQGLPGLTVERPQSNIVFADLAGDRAAGPDAAPEVARRARDGPLSPALRHPPRRRRRRRRPRHRPPCAST